MIFLDEIGELPAALQVKLLRVLQERAVEPLGASAALPIDVRVVATTGRDLLDQVELGEFREDLYYRLAVVTLVVPPLRLRGDDFADLVPLLVARAAERDGVRPRPVGPEALERLREHPWPGNVRELENALERVLVLGTDEEPAAPIRASELEFLAETRHGVADEVAGQALAHGLTVDELTQAMMERALEEQRGNVSAAARQVGLTRRAFDYRRGRSADRVEPVER